MGREERTSQGQSCQTKVSEAKNLNQYLGNIVSDLFHTLSHFSSHWDSIHHLRVSLDAWMWVTATNVNNGMPEVCNSVNTVSSSC